MIEIDFTSQSQIEVINVCSHGCHEPEKLLVFDINLCFIAVKFNKQGQLPPAHEWL